MCIRDSALHTFRLRDGQRKVIASTRHPAEQTALLMHLVDTYQGLQITSGSFAANSAWLVLAAIAFNLTRAAGTIASVFHAKATTATIRRQLIAVPGRLARSARRLVIHLPKDWPWQDSWEGLFNTVCGPPNPAAT